MSNPHGVDRELTLLGVARDGAWGARLDLLEHMRSLTMLVRDGRICFVNSVGLEWLGHASGEALLGLSFDALLHHDYTAIAELGMEVLAEEALIPLKLIRRNRSEIEVEMAVSQLGGSDERIFLVEARDITEHLRAARALRLREQWLEGIINTVADGIVTIDGQGRIQSFNPAAEHIFHINADEIIGHNIRELLPEAIANRMGAEPGCELHRIASMGEEMMGLRKDGNVFPIEISVREMVMGDNISYTSVVRDVTARRNWEDYIRNLAHHDALTGLPNRFLFGDRLEQAVQRAHRHNARMALVFIDLDHFKPLNDTHGHAAGDHMLSAIAHRLEGAMRESDTVARIGGDEFVAILEDMEQVEDVLPCAERIFMAVTKPTEIAGTVVALGASLGVAFYPDHATDPQALINIADSAMYRAKRQRCNRVVVHECGTWRFGEQGLVAESAA